MSIKCLVFYNNSKAFKDGGLSKKTPQTFTFELFGKD